MKYIVKSTFLVFLLAFVLIGCSGRKYYEPKKIDANLNYTDTLKATLSDVGRDGATLSDGEVVTKEDGLLSLVIPKGYRFVNQSDGVVIITSGSGDMKILTKNGEVIFEKSFENQLASATLKGDLLAMVFENNMIMLYDIKKDHMIYKEPLSHALAVDARLANPLFLNDLVVFATLDGRLLIMDSKKKIVLRDVAISNKDLFNNVTFLSVIDNTLIAATSSKVISIDPKQIHHFSVDVKDVIFNNHNVYVFTKSGKVILLDESLNKKKEIKFPYALFSTVFVGDKLYAVEKEGYLIEIENDLSSYRVLKMPDSVESSLYGTKNKLFFADKYINIK